MSNDEDIAIFIPTLATRSRARYLLRAIESVHSQDRVRVKIIVVVNGPDCDPDLLRTLECRKDLTRIRLEPADFPMALKVGRDAVDTPFFGELDDDDELLPDALASRLDAMRRDTTLDAVVTNGVVRGNGIERLNIKNIDAVRQDPVRTLMASNWLLPGSALLRSETVTNVFFAGIPRYLEWTYLGLILAMRCRIAFLGKPTVVHYTDLPFSTDRSRLCSLGRVEALREILRLELPDDVKRTVRAKIGNALHLVSTIHLGEGAMRAAWVSHLQSMAYPGGLKYLPYTHRLLDWPRRKRDRRQDVSLVHPPDR